jgi:hypothetical protein
VEGVIKIEGDDHDEVAPEMLILAGSRLTVPENPFTLDVVSEN